MSEHNEDFPIFTDDVIREKIKPYKMDFKKYSAKERANKVLLADIARILEYNSDYLRKYIQGIRRISDVYRRRLSKLLIMLETGRLEKRNHIFYYNEHAKNPVLPVSRLTVSSEGIKMETVNLPQGSTKMPSFKGTFVKDEVKEIPKHLLEGK